MYFLCIMGARKERKRSRPVMPRVVVQATGRQAAHLGTDRRDTVIQAAGTSVIGSWGSRNKCNRFRGQQEQVQ